MCKPSWNDAHMNQRLRANILIMRVNRQEMMKTNPWHSYFDKTAHAQTGGNKANTNTHTVHLRREMPRWTETGNDLHLLASRHAVGFIYLVYRRNFTQ